jgi:hypothetical protein
MNWLSRGTASLLACLSSATAAEIAVIRTGSGVPLVVVSGELQAGDAHRFRSLTSELSTAAVILEGPGGALREGLMIGRNISSLGFATGVAPNTVCASACALAWVAGSPRYMAPTSLIGFHAAWEDNGGQAVPSGVGNALVGAYLAEMGVEEKGIIFATSAGPDGVLWLDIFSAKNVGIEVRVLGVTDSAEHEPAEDVASFPLQLPSGYRWIVLASARTRTALANQRVSVSPYPTLTVATSTGYYALVTGPFTKDVAEQLLAQWTMSATVPSDAYLSSGRGFLGRLEQP